MEPHLTPSKSPSPYIGRWGVVIHILLPPISPSLPAFLLILASLRFLRHARNSPTLGHLYCLFSPLGNIFMVVALTFRFLLKRYFLCETFALSYSWHPQHLLGTNHLLTYHMLIYYVHILIMSLVNSFYSCSTIGLWGQGSVVFIDRPQTSRTMPSPLGAHNKYLLNELIVPSLMSLLPLACHSSNPVIYMILLWWSDFPRPYLLSRLNLLPELFFFTVFWITSSLNTFPRFICKVTPGHAEFLTSVSPHCPCDEIPNSLAWSQGLLTHHPHLTIHRSSLQLLLLPDDLTFCFIMARYHDLRLCFCSWCYLPPSKSCLYIPVSSTVAA